MFNSKPFKRKESIATMIAYSVVALPFIVVLLAVMFGGLSVAQLLGILVLIGILELLCRLFRNIGLAGLLVLLILS